MFILGVNFWAKDFAILTQSSDKSRESSSYWINYNWAKLQKNPVKEKDKYFCAAIHLEEKKMFPDDKPLFQRYIMLLPCN